MGKAILVLDEMPEDCRHCDLRQTNMNGQYCGVSNDHGSGWPMIDWTIKERPDWCPLQEVEPVRYAEWLYFDEYDDLRRCSECDHVVKAENISQYCPHCGAKMDGETE